MNFKWKVTGFISPNINTRIEFFRLLLRFILVNLPLGGNWDSFACIRLSALSSKVVCFLARVYHETRPQTHSITAIEWNAKAMGTIFFYSASSITHFSYFCAIPIFSFILRFDRLLSSHLFPRYQCISFLLSCFIYFYHSFFTLCHLVDASRYRIHYRFFG